MHKNNNFIQQTHFIGVLIPDDITCTLEDCRHYMNQAFGCRSGHGTPIHVTLVPPFKLPEEFSTLDLITEFENICVCCGKPAKALVYWGRAY